MSSDCLYQVIPKNLCAQAGSADSFQLQHVGCGCSRPALAHCGWNLGSSCWERTVQEGSRRRLTGGFPWAQELHLDSDLAHSPCPCYSLCPALCHADLLLTCLSITTDLLHHHILVWQSGPLEVPGCHHQTYCAPLSRVPWDGPFVWGPLPCLLCCPSAPGPLSLAEQPHCSSLSHGGWGTFPHHEDYVNYMLSDWHGHKSQRLRFQGSALTTMISTHKKSQQAAPLPPVKRKS